MKEILFSTFLLVALFLSQISDAQTVYDYSELYYDDNVDISETDEGTYEADELAKYESLMNEDIAISSTGKKYYRGMLCTIDCSGHKAGYEWAYYKDITDEDECINASNSFMEGCLKGVDDVNEYY